MQRGPAIGLLQIFLLSCPLLLSSVRTVPVAHHEQLTPKQLNSWAEGPEYRRQEFRLREIIEACVDNKNDVIWLHSETKKLMRLPGASFHMSPGSAFSSACPLLDIMLLPSERGVGMCTDVALYILHAGARLLPELNMTLYNRACNFGTARLFLESMYGFWVHPNPQVIHIMLPNGEHLFKEHFDMHQQMNLYLSKARCYVSSLKSYVTKELRTQAQTWLMGHTSSDLSIGALTDTPDFSRIIHVRGKSGLKHTDQVLDCWNTHPDLPTLTLLGQYSQVDVPLTALSRRVHLITPPGLAGNNSHLTNFRDLRQLVAAHGIHICPSEREGFGHYINEARSVGALVLTTNHAPMNNLITVDRGVLIQGVCNITHDWQALGQYGPLGVAVDAASIYDAVIVALNLTLSERRERGQAARRAFLRGRRQLESNMHHLVEWLEEKRRKARRRRWAKATARPARKGWWG